MTATFLIALAAVLVLTLPGPVVRRRTRRLPATAPLEWRVQVTPAQRYQADYYGGDRGSVPLRGEVAVRLVRGGTGMLTIGTVKMDAVDFEPSLQTVLSAAEERASALNAVEQYTN